MHSARINKRISETLIFKSAVLFVVVMVTWFFMTDSAASQQSIVVVNGDFENGDLNGWQIEGESSIVATGFDSFANGSLQRVAGGNFSAMIGDEIPWGGNGIQQSSLEQTVNLPEDYGTNAVLQFAYAVVANDPPNHPEEDKPRFRVVVEDITANKTLTDTEYIYTSQSSSNWYLGQGTNLSVYQPFYTLNSDRWIFQPWKEVQIPISGLEGHKIRIRFEVRDCNWGAHPAYGYLDAVSVGSPIPIQLPALVGNPSPAQYITPPFWAPILQSLEKLHLIWLCCLLPLLFGLLFLLWWLLRRRSPSMYRARPMWIPSQDPSDKEENIHKGGGAVP